MKNEIVKINASDYGLEESKAKEIEAMFLPMLSKMKDLESEFNNILKLPINPETCQMAKDLRMAYVKTRTGTDKIHKDLKAFYLSGGRFVDAFKNTQSFASGEKEQVLKSIEDHFENQEKERIEKLRISREKLLIVYTEIMPLALGHMEQSVFDNYLTGVKIAHEARIAAEKKAEEERIAAVKKDAEEREAQRLENLKLKADAEERERLAEIERKKQADILAKERAKSEAERKERERLEVEIEKKKQAIEAERKAQIAAEKKAAKAPDKIKLIALSETIGKIEMPEVKSPEAKEVIESTKILLQKVVTFLNGKSETL
jgi:hypothetical protein